MDDELIVELYWQRREDAITETDIKYGTYCYSISYGILCDASDAEESVNDTYLAAWNAIPPQRPDILRAFLGKLARRISISRWRKNTAKKRGSGQVELALEELSWCIPQYCTLSERVELEELSAAIDSFLRAQSEEKRNIFVLRYWYCKSVAEISRKMGCSEGRVKTTLFRLRERLAKHLVKEGLIDGC